jgi:sentrin-specific protease 1
MKKVLSKLSAEESAVVDYLLGDEPVKRLLLVIGVDNAEEDIVAHDFSVPIKQRDVLTLRPNHWLNDQIINFYFAFLQNELNKEASSAAGNRTVLMNTFFAPQLLRGYQYVRRWLSARNLRRMLGHRPGHGGTTDSNSEHNSNTCAANVVVNTVFDLEKLIIPVHSGGIHWCLAVVCFRSHQILFYDSARDIARESPWRHAEATMLAALMSWVRHEASDKIPKYCNSSIRSTDHSVSTNTSGGSGGSRPPASPSSILSAAQAGWRSAPGLSPQRVLPFCAWT